MPEESRRTSVARAHVAALAFGWGIDGEQLVDALVGGCWPTPPTNREQMTPEFLRRIRTEAWPLRPPACECDTGHCLICN